MPSMVIYGYKLKLRYVICHYCHHNYPDTSLNESRPANIVEELIEHKNSRRTVQDIPESKPNE